MKKRGISVLLSATLLLSCLQFTGCTKNDNAGGSSTMTNTPTATITNTQLPTINYTTENLYEHPMPEWFRDAKFGIFIHYGIYSVPAFGDEWYGHWMYMKNTKAYGGSDIYSYHLNTYGGSKVFGYKDFIPEFAEALKKYKATNMAEEWAKLFHEAGAQYVMPVGIHHDSFALYDSGVQTTYNSVTQADMDYIGDLQKAVDKYGMKFGISNHFAENDWFFDDAYAVGTDLSERNEDGTLKYGELYGDGKSKSEAHVRKWYEISMEIIDKYHPDMIYYDFDLGQNPFARYDDANRYLMLKNYYEQAQRYNPEGVVCCNKYGAFTESEALLEKERSSLNSINPTAWQTDTSIGLKSWGYTTDEVYRSGSEFIGALVDIVSKNGNLLLNVGPMPDGTIPEEARTALVTIGKWLSTYGDAIYATRPWLTAGEGATSNTGDSFVYRPTDIRFTRSKDNTVLYATALARPTGDTMRIRTLARGLWDASTIKSVSLINGKERIPLVFMQTEDALEISLGDNKPDTAYSIEITFTDDQIPPIALSAGTEIQPNAVYNYEDCELGHCKKDGSDTFANISDKASLRALLDFSNVNYGSVNLSVSGASKGTITCTDIKTGDVIFSANIDSAPDKLYRTVSVPAVIVEGTGVLDIQMTFTGRIELDSFRFVVKRMANSEIDASVFDEKKGAVQSEPTKDVGGGNSLGYVEGGDYVKFTAVDFGLGCNKMQIRAGADRRGFCVYIDSISNENLLCSGKVSTGGYDNYTTLEKDIKITSGVHDVYFVFTDPATNLNWIKFITAK